jgi:hypothetical protein
LRKRKQSGPDCRAAIVAAAPHHCQGVSGSDFKTLSKAGYLGCRPLQETRTLLCALRFFVGPRLALLRDPGF